MTLAGLQAARSTCSFCPKLCRHVCPAAEAERDEVATPTFKQQVALQAASGARPLDAERARALYKCTDCRATVPACRHRIDVGASLREGRALAVRQGVAPPEVARVAERFARTGSPYASSLRDELARALPAAARAGSSTTVLFPACASAARGAAEVRDTLAVLEALDAPLAVALPDPPCCGYPLDALGLDEAFARHAERVARSLAGHAEVVATGPACAHALAVRYAAVGVHVRFKVTPLVDVLARHTRTIAARGRGAPPARPAYHDACFLGRKLGRYDEPRAVLRAALGEDALELPCAREEALCSGGGGGYPLTNPGPAAACAARVLRSAREVGGAALVTACPSAGRLLGRSDPSAKVLSLAGVLADRLGLTRALP